VLKNGLLQKYKDKFNIDRFIVGAKQAFKSVVDVLGNEEFVDFCNGYV
jgi:hypothetical protein